MDYHQANIVAKKVAMILADNEATVNDLNEIFHLTRNYLTVSFNDARNKHGYSFGAYVPEVTYDSNGETNK